jgi:hypothetical protein
MSQINYKSKYLKYKTKYLFIKNNQIDQGFRSSLNLLKGGAANPVDNLTFKRNFGIELDKIDIPPDNIDPLELQHIYYENIKKQKLQEQEQEQKLQEQKQELQKREQELQKLKDDIKKQELELQKKKPVTQTSTSQSVTQSIVSNVSNVAESKNLEQRLYESKQNEFP